MPFNGNKIIFVINTSWLNNRFEKCLQVNKGGVVSGKINVLNSLVLHTASLRIPELVSTRKWCYNPDIVLLEYINYIYYLEKTQAELFGVLFFLLDGWWTINL